MMNRTAAICKPHRTGRGLLALVCGLSLLVSAFFLAGSARGEAAKATKKSTAGKAELPTGQRMHKPLQQAPKKATK
jgi:hypothetical protein